MNARDIMTHDPMTAAMTARVRDALNILQTLEIRHLPVVNEKNELVGMISDRDLRNARIPMTTDDTRGPNGAYLDAKVTDVMSSDVVTVGPEADVGEIIDLMLENKVGAVPVVEDSTGDLLGIVSYVDVLREMRGVLE